MAQIVRTQLASRPEQDLNSLAERCPDFDAKTTKFAHVHSLCGGVFFHDGSVLSVSTGVLRCGQGQWTGYGGYRAHYQGGRWIWGHALTPESSMVLLGHGPFRPTSVARGLRDILRTQNKLGQPWVEGDLVPRRLDTVAMHLIRGSMTSWRTLLLFDDGSYLGFLGYGSAGWQEGRNTVYISPTRIADWVGDRTGFYWACACVPVSHTPHTLVRVLAAVRAEPVRGEILEHRV